MAARPERLPAFLIIEAGGSVVCARLTDVVLQVGQESKGLP